MPPFASFSCWLIGADSLLAECGDLLLRAGHRIEGVIAPPGRIAEWAASKSLATVDPKSDYGQVLAANPFDYLFAITHLALVPDAVLGLPKRCAINFHDGPLFDYAGLNAPVWALIQRESRYGITWHAMTSTIDAGDILKQRQIDIARDETALSLHTKCFEAGLASFGELVGELESQSLRPVQQDWARRRYFERHRRPRAACAIDWTRSAAEIEALVRALTFGPYPNPVGLAKIRRGTEVLVVSSARASKDPQGPAAWSDGRSPGTVLAIDEQQILVASGRGALALRGFTDLRGAPLTPQTAARRLGLGVGIELDNLDYDSAKRLSELDRQMSRAERHWIQRLRELDPIGLPCAVAAAAPGALVRARSIDVKLPDELGLLAEGLPRPSVITAAFAAYIGRLARRENFDIGHCDETLRAQGAGFEAWLVARLPLRVEFQGSLRFADFAARVAEGLAEIRRRGPWLRDLVARQPSLHALREDGPAHVLPLAVEHFAGFTTPALPEGAECTVEVAECPLACRFVYDAQRISEEHAQSLARGFEAFLASLVARPSLALAAHGAVDPAQLEREFELWNRSAPPKSRDICIHQLFEEQARRTPETTAIVCAGRSTSYGELASRARLFASRLRELGVGAGSLVGICVDRSHELVIAILGVLEAGGAYLPLDPGLPAARLAFMLGDAQLKWIVSRTRLAASLPPCEAQIVCIDGEPARAASQESPARGKDSTPSDLAYAIYTSGSTGEPKGVLVEHRQVASFFEAIDEKIPHDPPGTWLAVTGLYFDISVLELLWTLTRGFTVVIHSGFERSAAPARASVSRRHVDFSLFYFASDEGREGGDGYRLLLEGARFADANGFRAVWTPERHFHAFGGLYPNPALTGAALAMVTRRIEIRAGSVVLPLHHPARVAEEWALVDSLSNGRVAISFASGWHPDDFVLAPQNHADAKGVMLRGIDVVRRLWRGEAVSFPGPDGAAVEVRTLPRPVQAELPVWLTSAGNIETYAAAGRLGANLLTHLLGQSIEELAPKIAAYRDARAEAGFDPASGVVSLMLHTFVGEDEARVRELVKEPLERYLKTALSLVGKHASAFPAHRRTGAGGANDQELAELSSAEQAAVLAHARERYYESNGLFGTPERCAQRVQELRAIGVDEIACLIDFGVPVDEVLQSLPVLDRVRAQAQAGGAAESEPQEPSLAETIRNHGVTHLQCTPSMARILCSDDETRAALKTVRQLFVGGEGLPAGLASELSSLCEHVTNLYGPTETTIWSSAHPLRDSSGAAQLPGTGTVPIGRPLANSLFYVLDAGLKPVPIGVAGELVIGGAGVARGYLRRPELDAQRFVPDPWASEPGARMYRTGDLVRYRFDGVVEFIGRIDHQIKVRGHRIEPAEIEGLLAREASVAEAVVVAREDTPGDQRLVAYIVARDKASDSEALRAALARELPEFMVPSQFVFVEKLPRTPNGKLDRRALPSPRAATRPPADCAPPASELESRLAQLWQETLGVESLGVEDNFFDLGGHSLLAVRIHRRLTEMELRGELATRVSLTDLFRFPTIRSLARYLSAEVAQGGVQEAALRGRLRRASMLRRREPASEA